MALHLADRRPILTAFLDALSLPHEDGVLKEESEGAPVTPDEARAALRALSGFPRDQVVTYLNTLWLQDPVRWAALEEATSNKELAREAHTLASTCRSFGLPSIGEKIACIEQHAKFGEAAGEPPCIAATGRELVQGAAALKAAMERYRGES